MGLRLLLPCLFLAILIGQLFIPPVTGLADNGDFPKITGSLCLIPVENPQYSSEYNYFVSQWQRDENWCSSSLLATSEKPLTWVAWKLSQLFGRTGQFDVRWLGAIHLLIYVVGFVAIVRAFDGSPKGVRWIAWIFAAMIMTDLSYTAYLLTFYTDAAAICAFFAFCGLSLYLCCRGQVSAAGLSVVGVAAALYVTSKPSHAFAGIPIAIFLVLLSMNCRGRIKAVAGGWAAALIVMTVAMQRSTPEVYTLDPFFSIVFYEIIGRSAAPEADLAALGLSPEHMAAKGMYTYQDLWPANDVPWKLKVYRQAGGYAGLGRFYFTHPTRAVEVVIRAMREGCRDIRPLLLANFRRQDGFGPGSQSRRFGQWSSLKRSVYIDYAPYLLLVYLAALIGGAVLWRKGVAAGFWILMVWCIGFGELLISTLADACETSRHLLLFHAATDVLLGALLLIGVRLAIRRGTFAAVT